MVINTADYVSKALKLFDYTNSYTKEKKELTRKYAQMVPEVLRKSTDDNVINTPAYRKLLPMY